MVRRIYDMYLSGLGGDRIAKILNAEGYRTVNGNEWRDSSVLCIIDNEKFMGNTIMGKSVMVNGEKHDNSDGSLGKRYYMEDTHEGIVSKEVWHKAQELRQQRKNPKLVGSEIPVYPFTGIIECSQCGAHYQHILVKSISRFARNTVDALQYIRELRDLGISVYFEKDYITNFKTE